MDANTSNKQTYALLGKNISYSFSRNYFTNKFANEHILNSQYINFDVPSLENFISEIKNYPNLCGMNVTIPYKQAVISFLNELDPIAQRIGAVNTIEILPNGNLKGHNTDYIGFWQSITPLLKPHHNRALLLGTGGASKAIAFAFENAGIPFSFVSRTKAENTFLYEELSSEIIENHPIIVNCTPLGTFPKVTDCPAIPYQAITQKHLLYDLIYNPPLTRFLQEGKQQNATICNGEPMLVLQAEASWRIWQGISQGI